ncbi:hypothetical protein B0O99DRAFT_244535 [Bisporella sp. PMI_857]|nr:hypothetical protein B0O99DRAFT_244535 [Bisporella sp. PMI_857]
MAIKTNPFTTPTEESGYLSDDSSFYGDTPTKQDLSARASSFSAAHYFKIHLPSPTEIALANRAKMAFRSSSTLYNPYEGASWARQLGESVDDFLRRIPPRTTQGTEEAPWIYVANPYRKAPAARPEATEAPPEEESDWAGFVVRGNEMLEEIVRVRNEIARQNEGRTRSVITGMVNVEKDKLVHALRDAAKRLKCTSGKWMLFVDPIEINAVWSVVAHATANNQLGIASKVAPDFGDPRKERLVCIYTKDFTDIEDVTRVARRMKDLGLIEAKKAIYYKCDAYTYLGIARDNQWDIKPSLYSSKDILSEGGQKKVPHFFYKKEEKDNRPDIMDWE